jgi:hypothetical protein
MRTPHSILLLGAALLWAAGHAAHAATHDGHAAKPARDACVSRATEAVTQQVRQQQRDIP